MPQTMLIAIGGNSLLRAGEQADERAEQAHVAETAKSIAALARRGHRIIITHGNGPQVGAALLRAESADREAHRQPLDVCGASTQGEIGYLLQQALHNELARAGGSGKVVSVITQTVVWPGDPAFEHPTKPVGLFYSTERAQELCHRFGWHVVEDGGRGYRRVVPSPDPIDIVEIDVIRELLARGVLVIAGGGGGIPVVRAASGLKGVEAVIDKDRTSALMAERLGAELLVICTEADFVYLDYGKRTQVPLRDVTAGKLAAHLRAGHFPPGNMGPKIESAIRFLRHGGREVIITSQEHLLEAIEGRAGTHIMLEMKRAETKSAHTAAR
jgi:carbamate kinase